MNKARRGGGNEHWTCEGDTYGFQGLTTYSIVEHPHLIVRCNTRNNISLPILVPTNLLGKNLSHGSKVKWVHTCMYV